MNESLSILVVDDNPSIASILADILDVKGFEVHAANSGAEAIEILQDHPVDVMLPDMNGVELYRATRKLYPNLTTVLMTAYAADDLIQQGLTEGIKTVLSKPVNIDYMLVLFDAHKRIYAK
jgi:CheY-like chemotaxis protein